MTKPRLIFTAPQITSGFMEHDIALMSPYVDVIRLDLSECGGFQRYTYFTHLLRALVRERAEVLFAYFVTPKYTPLAVTLARILGRKIIVITGGIDATHVPDINWGDMRFPLRRRLFAYTMRLTHSVLPFSNASRDDLLHYGQPRRIRTAYLAVDTDVFRPNPQPPAHPRRAVTACYSISQSAILQKGVGPFVASARYAPEVEFVVVGEDLDGTVPELQREATPNVTFINRRLNKYECAEVFQTAQVYVQASAHEGFGVSLAEGMACGCVPVVANRYAMPETAGGTGYVVPFNDPPELARAIQEAMQHPEKGEAARQRVVEHFTSTQRQALLREELEFVLGRPLAAQ